jgi:hypothetical protein
MNPGAFQNLVFVVLIVLTLLYGVAHQSRVIMFAIPVALPLIIFSRRLDLWWALTIVLTGMRISSVVSGALEMSHLFAFGFGVLMVLNYTIHRPLKSNPLPASHRFAIAFALISVVLALYRGIGIQAVGSSMWGGMQYVILWTGVLFCIQSYRLQLSPQFVKKTVYLFFILALVPFIVSALNSALGGRLNFAQNFFIGTVVADAAAVGGQEMQRMSSAVSSGGSSLIILGWILLRPDGRRLYRSLFLFAIGAAIMGNAGFRGALISIGMTSLFYVLMQRRTWNPRILRTLILFSSLAGVLILLNIRHLPYGFQRMLAWIPGLPVSLEAKLGADVSTEWRVEMWKSVILMIPDYLLIGRGMAFDLGSAYQAYIATEASQHAFFIATHGYHNGPLYLLIDHGAPGFICGLGMMLCTLRRHWMLHKRPWPDETLKKMHTMFLCLTMAQIISFFGIFGALESITRLLLNMAMLEVLWRSANFQIEAPKDIYKQGGLRPPK